MAHNYITGITKSGNGFTYTLKTPPTGGYCIYLNGRALAVNAVVSEYFLQSNETLPPPIEVALGTGNMIDPQGEAIVAPSIYAGNSVYLRWRHVAGASWYQIELSVNGGTFLSCGLFLFSGGLYGEYRADDITQDCETTYRVTPGIMVEGLFTPIAPPLVQVMQRITIPKPIPTKITGYDYATKTLTFDRITPLL